MTYTEKGTDGTASVSSSTVDKYSCSIKGADDDSSLSSSTRNNSCGDIEVGHPQSTPLDSQQWPNSKRSIVVIIVGLFAFLEVDSSSMNAPCLGLIANDFDISSSVMHSFLLSSFVLPYAVGALILAPFSEYYGRKPVLLVSVFVFLVFNTACGFAQNRAQFLVFRVIPGLGGCVPLAIGNAMVGDLYAAHERGTAMAVYFGMQLSGPALGPILGAWIAQTINSWRWTFYSCSVATAVVLVPGIFMPETFAPKLNRSERPPVKEGLCSLRRPLVSLAMQPIIQVLAIYAAIFYGIFYLFLTTMSTVFVEVYHESLGLSSFHYLAIPLGFAFSMVASGRAMDLLYIKYSREKGPCPEARIPYLITSGTILPVGLLLYGWTTQYEVFWFVADIGLFLISLGILAPLVAIQHYILDCYSGNNHAASATAAMNVARFLAAFGFPLFADELFESLARMGKFAACPHVGGCEMLLSLAVVLWSTAAPDELCH